MGIIKNIYFDDLWPVFVYDFHPSYVVNKITRVTTNIRRDGGSWKLQASLLLVERSPFDLSKTLCSFKCPKIQ